ncbi:MAG TPA: hypothetical protein VHN81_06450 [Edaphobacter sp.]|nr:hypothetical protein [Edaphobacter sp.]
MKKGLLRGNKFSRSHTTVIPEAVEFLACAKGIALVNKISIGLITPCPSGPIRIKIKTDPHALRVQARGRSAIQTFYIYGGDLSAIEQSLVQNPVILAKL